MLNKGYSWKYIAETLERDQTLLTTSLKRLIGIEKFNEINNKYTEIQRKRITEEIERPYIIEKLESLGLMKYQQYPILTDQELTENNITENMINEIKLNEIGIKALSEKYNIDSKIIKRIIFN